MNETGSYPGQPWLWLYALWYQVEPMKSSPNADIQVLLIMGLLSLAFICIPFIPGINALPRKIPIYKLIWKEHYRAREGERVRSTKRREARSRLSRSARSPVLISPRFSA